MALLAAAVGTPGTIVSSASGLGSVPLVCRQIPRGTAVSDTDLAPRPPGVLSVPPCGGLSPPPGAGCADASCPVSAGSPGPPVACALSPSI